MFLWIIGFPASFILLNRYMTRRYINLPGWILLLSLAAIGSSWVAYRHNYSTKPTHASFKEAPKLPIVKARIKAGEARQFVRQRGYNNVICFLVDMSLPSGQNRFFVFNLKRDTVVNAALVTHGRCNQDWLEGRRYGNSIGCGCSSLGKYKIGHAYNGRFGLAYKLYGLEKTNDNAFKRFVVLHSHECVPETEVPDEICQSDGCPTIAPGFLQQLKPMIDRADKPILLWIYD